jgi:hypothetical protein
MTFHPGEKAVQTLAGVRADAEKLLHHIGCTLKPAAQEFVVTQSLAIASTVASEGNVWCSLLTGDQGFIQAVDNRTLLIQNLPAWGDPLHNNLIDNASLGLLVIDLANRRRLRLNGQAQVDAQCSLTLQIQEVFFNCPKYIQTRHLISHLNPTSEQPTLQTRTSLSPHDHRWLTTTDTLFIASFNPASGADASHRGGFPGFIQVVGDRQLVFPDYVGNNMFQTFGNLQLNPRAGLLFIDFEQGHTLQLTGTAQVIWEQQHFAKIPGAERLVEFSISQILETTHATSRRWQFGDYSPANPGSRLA